MSPKAILIAFVIVSLLLIGVMFLAVDGRNNTLVPKSENSISTQKKSQEQILLKDSIHKKDNGNLQEIKDSIRLQKIIDSLQAIKTTSE
jgi:uncharacterized membrane protein YeiB